MRLYYLLWSQLIWVMKNNVTILRYRGKIVKLFEVYYIRDILLVLFYLLNHRPAINIPYNYTKVISSRNKSFFFILWKCQAVNTSTVSIQSKQRILLTYFPKLNSVIQATWSKAFLHKRIVLYVHNKMRMLLKCLDFFVLIVLMLPKEYIFIITASQYFLSWWIIYNLSKKIGMSFKLIDFSLRLIIIYFNMQIISTNNEQFFWYPLSWS